MSLKDNLSNKVGITDRIFYFLSLKLLKNGLSMNKCTKVSDTGLCPYCKSRQIVKNGTTKNKKQQFLCKVCKKRFIDFYTNKAYVKSTDESVITLTKEGLGIRSIARVLHISTTTVIKRILSIAKKVNPPKLSFNQSYEVDEINTFVGSKKKRIWVVCALERETRKVVRFAVGFRSNKTISKITSTLMLAKATCIYTDKLLNYRYLINDKIHKTSKYGTNHIERKFLTLRAHIKRLNRRTLGFSKSIVVLQAIIRIYFYC